ncbi:phytanoyl-CoA dioxygenase family protein [Actinokineospora inagensis]|uniref:phytanoyl-CoA dioxygenase family protein n=1 Tax=Actinokineospora inagensis TaxID=103730 RepID=UPI00040D337B|nr:phytanoyl-CoA dioxygenase family protein [Actinokineospora inagensis]
MDRELVDRFTADGFLKLDQAVPADVAQECARLLWAEIPAEPDDPATWTEPVHWVAGMGQEPFAQAINTPVLHDAFDTLIGPGRWAPRDSMGSFPLRFPHESEPNDAGWHIEGSYQPPGAETYWTNVHSTGRVLLMLFLFTDIDEHNAPTRIRIGSHMDAPAVLREHGSRGASIFHIGPDIEAASAHRPIALATGRVGDVYLCHPFLVHAAQPNHGNQPRFLGQPALLPSETFHRAPFSLTVLDHTPLPIARTIRDALHGDLAAE